MGMGRRGRRFELKTRFFGLLALILPALFGASVPARAQETLGLESSPAMAPVGVSRAECFPVERLRPEQRARAEFLLLKALDGEALYTLVGGIKPMSSGWLSLNFDPAKPDAAELDDYRQIVRALRCGDEISAHLTAFAQSYNGKRALQGTFWNRKSLGAMLETRAGFWNTLAISPESEPLETLMATEYAAPDVRFRAYGFLFGFPTRAVDFFVGASQTQAADPAKKLVPRDFFSVPTFAGKTHRFVYAVPKGAPPDGDDLLLLARCRPILAEYKRRRALYIGPGKRGIVQLVRDWFDNGRGRCSPSFARH